MIETSAYERWFVMCINVAMHMGSAPEDYTWDLNDVGWISIFEMGMEPFDAVSARFNLH